MTEQNNWNTNSKFLLNKEKSKKYKAKIYSYENYPDEFYEKILEHLSTHQIPIKELKEGDIFDCSEYCIEGSNLYGIAPTGEKVEIIFGNSLEQEFILNSIGIELDTQNILNYFSQNPTHKIYIDKFTKTKIIGSLSKGQIYFAEAEFKEQIKNPSKYYKGYIYGKNNGGFLIEVCGVRGFLPGSLAAPNIVSDFNSLVDTKINVMVENWIPRNNMFVFSYKKYLNHVLIPESLSELDDISEYEGKVIGITRTGILCEFKNIFTGFLHENQMSPETRELFLRKEIRIGDVLYFRIASIDKDLKIYLRN